MKKTLKQFLATLLAAMVCLFAAGCAAPLPDGFDSDEVTARAEEIIDCANAGKFDSINENVREDLQDVLSVQTLEEAITPINERVGAFEGVEKVVLTGTTDSSTGEKYALALLVCAYEDGNILYKLSFDTDLNIVGLYLQ